MKLFQHCIYFALLLILASCANMGQGPQGGPRDTIPPALVKETPLNGTLHFSAKRIEVQFDEYIQLADVQKNVLISPPQQTPPEVKAVGKTLSVTFQEDLQDSTTYTIDFGAAICDYNEKVPLPGYVYAFSTGDAIDTLIVSGRIYDAATLDPVAGVMVGIQRNLHDSAFTTCPLSRITRTNDQGYFTIRNIHAGNYRLYALDDISRDYMYQPGEALGFLDSLVTPLAILETHNDTIWQDTIGIDPLTMDTLFTRLFDSVYTHTVTRFSPDSLVLMYFQEARQRHYFQKVLRDEQHVFTLLFSAPQDSLPAIRALRPSDMDSLASDSAWVNFLDYTLLQTSRKLDTLTFWLTDSLAIQQDSIYFEMQYMASDSLYNLVPMTDTILAVYRHPRLSDKAREQAERKKRERKLTLKPNHSLSFDIFDTLQVRSDYPLDSVHTEMFHLWQTSQPIADTRNPITANRVPVAISVMPADSIRMTFNIIANLQPETTYMLKIDSAACRDIYGVSSDSIEVNIKLKSLDDYASLTVILTHFDSLARIQLLNENDKVLRELPALVEGTKFENLEATSFYIRMYIDLNADGQWTTGDWLSKRQPEPIFYYPNKLKLRANWEFQENFDHLAIPAVESKPQALIGKKK